MSRIGSQQKRSHRVGAAVAAVLLLACGTPERLGEMALDLRNPAGIAARQEGYVNEDRIHRAISADGTEIVGRVRGEGPPLVLIHGGLGDGEQTWTALLPFLERNFTCYLMSTRGRGLSGEPIEPDYPFERLMEDVIAFTESIGEPVGLVGYSLGGSLGLGAAAHSNAIRAIAVYEPGVSDALTRETGAVFAESAKRLVEASAAGRMIEAARALLEPVAHDDEMAALTAAGAFEAWARNIPVAAQEIQRAGQWDGPGPTAPSTLARIDVPALYLIGSRARRWHRDAARYLAEHVDGLRVVEIEGAGHFGPLLSPEPIADELIRFFERIPELSTQPGRTPGMVRNRLP
jgi:pimeloyl-ACP methyl ester carboxylesterase